MSYPVDSAQYCSLYDWYINVSNIFRYWISWIGIWKWIDSEICDEAEDSAVQQPKSRGSWSEILLAPFGIPKMLGFQRSLFHLLPLLVQQKVLGLLTHPVILTFEVGEIEAMTWRIAPWSVEGTAEKIGYFATFEAGLQVTYGTRSWVMFFFLRFVVGCKDTCQKVRALWKVPVANIAITLNHYCDMLWWWVRRHRTSTSRIS